MGELRHDYVQVNGIRMHYVTAGRGPLLLLLHGFPEFWYSWRQQIPALARHFTVVAPDQRGYNETDKPTWGYEVDVLVSDVLELAQALGHERFRLVGHDWGGSVAWAAAITNPHRIEQLAIINTPHPAVFARHLRQNPEQQRRSWYMGFFQLPWLPELAMSANDYAAIATALRDRARPETISDADITLYKDAISKPGALTAALNWYRAAANPRRGPLSTGQRRCEVPTLLLWGEGDRYLSPALVDETRGYVPDLTIRRFPQASHWLAQEEPAAVNAELLRFFGAG